MDYTLKIAHVEKKVRIVFIAFICVAVLLASMQGAYVFGQAEGSVTISPTSFGKLYSYYLYGDGSSYTLLNGTYSTIATSSNATYLAQLAIDSMTTGRTWKEWIAFIGNFSITQTILIPDYTGVDMHSAYLALGADVSIFQNSGYGSTASSWCWFEGGVLNGWKKVNPSGTALRTAGSAIRGAFWNSDFVGMTIKGFPEWGMDFQSYSSSERSVARIRFNWIGTGVQNESNRLGGIRLGNDGYGCSDFIIHDNYLINNGNYQVRIEEGATHRFSDNHYAGWADPDDNQCMGVYSEGDVDKVQMYGGHYENIYKEAVYINATSGSFSDSWEIIGNTYYQCSRGTNDTYATIMIDANSGQSRFGTVSLNKFTGDETFKAKYCVWWEGTNANWWTALGNSWISNAYADSAYQDDAANNDIAHNINV